MNDEYMRAAKRGEKEMKKSGEDSLPSLEQILPNFETESKTDIGITEIPSDMVIGTVYEKRGLSFYPGFMPKSNAGSEFMSKWMRLYNAQLSEGIRDPIKVYEYRHRFYVEEGNKRTSVLKYLDSVSMEADVIRINDDNDPVYQEFLAFYKDCPVYDIDLSREGEYPILSSLIEERLKKPWTREDINTIRGAFFRFCSILKEEDPKHTVNPSDAFLLYLRIYKFDSLLDEKRSFIAKRVSLIKEECNTVIETKSLPEKKAKNPFFTIPSPPLYTEYRPLRILFVYKGKKEDGLTTDHETGRIYLNHLLEGVVETEAVYECSTEEHLHHAVNRSDWGMVISPDEELYSLLMKEALDHKSVRFLCHTEKAPMKSLHTYRIKTDEIRILLGILAGIYGKDQIGYLPNTGLQAFAYGVSMVNPKAEVIHESDHIDTIYISDEPEEAYGLMHNNIQLAYITFHWGRYYEELVKSVISGKYDQMSGKAMQFCYGEEAGVVDLSVSSSVPEQTKKLLDLIRKAGVTL